MLPVPGREPDTTATLCGVGAGARGRVAGLLLAAALMTTACAGSSDEVGGRAATAAQSTPAAATTASEALPTSPTTPATETAVPPPAAPSVSAPPTWRVGATPLPLRADGFGEVLPTPPELVDRRIQAADRLPPPADGGFASTIGPVDEAVIAQIGTAWQPGCPVPLKDLRYLTLTFWGFDDRAHTGELIVNAAVGDDVVAVFRALYEARFPLEELRLVTGADLAAHPTGDGNVTAGFACRTAKRQTRWSAHAYGLAIDVNPFQNPFQRRDLVLPELASAYLDRTNVRPGMIMDDDVVVTAFESIGWTWGGNYRNSVDYMHFSATGL